MRLIYCFILFVLSLSSNAQNSRFVANPNPSSIEFTVDPMNPDHAAYTSISNKARTSINLLWTREILLIPSEWETYVCDKNLCYGPPASRCPENQPNVLSVGDSMSISNHINDYGVQGEAHIVLWFFEKEDTINKLKVDFLYNRTTSNRDVKNIVIKVYPNPAQNSFTVEYNTGLNQIELYNLLGKKVANYKTAPNKSYDISALEDGLYLLKLIGHNNAHIKTIRLQKRSFKA
ncbi:MAG: T9SS type A sorting domain-containing protein [Bacteroidota bacterium]|nr:T9SS type A sorting domain-containing protein [Bacteroidota bacterium]